MKVICKPNHRPYIIHTPNFTLMGEVEIGKSVMAIDPFIELETKDEDGNTIHTSGSVPEIFFEKEKVFEFLG